VVRGIFTNTNQGRRTNKELDELSVNKLAVRKFKSTKTQAELEGIQAKEMQAEHTIEY
jgi:SP family general alpha glucoside:H+ symporter-like MFS transporter